MNKLLIDMAMATAIKQNWVGLESHYTDQFVHASNKDPVSEMLFLRECWRNVLDNGSRKSLELLLFAAYECGRMNEMDNYEQ